jgi:RNA polymerase sigma factor (sigma-70 family)
VRGTEDLLEGFRAGSGEAIAEVLAQVEEVVGWYRWGIPVQDRGEVAQTVLVDLLKVVRTPLAIRRSFPALVGSIAMRRCVDWRRAQSRKTEALPEMSAPPQDDPENQLAARSRLEIASRALCQLPPAYRELIRLRLEEGLSYQEIAAKQGRSEDAVRQQWHTCVTKARHIVDGLLKGSGRPRSGTRSTT